MQAPLSTLRVCRKEDFGPTYSLDVINDGPYVWIIRGPLSAKSDPLSDSLEPKFALFREASQGQGAGLIVAPGQRVSTSMSDHFLPTFQLDFALQVEWEMLSSTVDLVKERGDFFIDYKAGPKARAAIVCSQAADNSAIALYPGGEFVRRRGFVG
jgi:hypothetical protein